MGFGVMHGGWRYAAASTIGTSHQNSVNPICQDAHALQFLPNLNAFAAVVADGAGSAAQSHLGSRFICDFVLGSLANMPRTAAFEATAASETLDAARTQLQAMAIERNCTLREFASTMLVAVVAQSEAAFWQIGDGAICFRERGASTFRHVFWPEKGTYANVTSFVTDPDAQSHLLHTVLQSDIEDLAVFSDGLERVALNFVAREAHTAFFDALFPYVHDLQEPGYSAGLSSQIDEFLASERVNKRTDDDKTLVLASSTR